MLYDIFLKVKALFMLPHNEASDSIKLNAKTCEIILDTLKAEFEAEENRNRHLEDKARTFITLAGILLTTAFFLIKSIVDNGWCELYILFVFISTVILMISLWKLVRVLELKNFERIKLQQLVTNAEMSATPEAVSSRLIVTYEQALIANRHEVDRKTDYFNSGVGLIKVAIGIYFVVFTFIALSNTDNIKKIFNINTTEHMTITAGDAHESPTKKGVNTMTDSNNSTGGEQGKPPSYGTVPVKKSEDTPAKPNSYGTIKIREGVENK